MLSALVLRPIPTYMKRAFRLSMFTNFLLVCVMVWLWHRSRVTEIPRPVPTSATRVGTNIDKWTAGVAKNVLQREPEGFHWSQIESTDYSIYVANLRSIGCPEQTIRDIITADVHTLYAAQLTQLACEGKESEGRYLHKAESSLLQALLGPELRGFSSIEPHRSRRDDNARQPLVFEAVDPKAAGLTDEQIEIFQRLRQTFIEEVGSRADRNDPAYRERWMTAQGNSDDLLQGLLGGEFYMEYQLRVPRLEQLP